MEKIKGTVDKNTKIVSKLNSFGVFIILLIDIVVKINILFYNSKCKRYYNCLKNKLFKK
jgi:hypothetical protein